MNSDRELWIKTHHSTVLKRWRKRQRLTVRQMAMAAMTLRRVIVIIEIIKGWKNRVVNLTINYCYYFNNARIK
jgi:hypothetical protein